MGLTRESHTTVAELYAATHAIFEVMSYGGYLIADHNGLWVCKGARVPWELRMRVAAMSVPIIELLIEGV